MTLLAICNRLFHTTTPLHLRGIPRLDLPKNQLWRRISAEQNLQQAFDWLCRQSRDSHPDSDVWDFRRNRAARMADLQQRLRRGTFQFQPVPLVEIRSPEGKTERREIRPAEDRLVIRAAAQVLGPVLQEHLSPHCTHLKGNGGLRKTVQDTQAFIGDHPGFHVIKSDIKGYYANIDHTLLADQFHALLPHESELYSLLYQFMRRTTEFGGNYGEVSRGLPLAASLSPLLGALYLSPLDHLAGECRGSFFRRYMDDWVWVLPTRHTLRKSVKKQYAVLHALGVEMHPDKTFINRCDRGFDFLGFHCRPTGLRVSDATLSRRDKKLTRLYEQGASKRRIGQYLVRWFGWVGFILPATLGYGYMLCDVEAIPGSVYLDGIIRCNYGPDWDRRHIDVQFFRRGDGGELTDTNPRYPFDYDIFVQRQGTSYWTLIPPGHVSEGGGLDVSVDRYYSFMIKRRDEPELCSEYLGMYGLLYGYDDNWYGVRSSIPEPIAVISPVGIQGGGEISVMIAFDKEVKGLVRSEMIVDHGSVVELTPSGGARSQTFSARINIDETYSGSVNVAIPCNAAQTLDNLYYSVPSSAQIYHDGRPHITIDNVPTTVTEPFEASFNFSEVVYGFDASDITVGNGAAGIVTGDGASYTSVITPGSEGQVTISVGADKANDLPYSQGNIASELKSTVYDARPTLMIDAPMPVNAPFTATFTFSEYVSGFDKTDITVTNGTASTVSGSGSSYTSEITPAADGFVTISVAADKAFDSPYNQGNIASEPKNTVYDTRPTVSISNVPTATNAPFTATFTFSEGVTGFHALGITVGNGTAGTVSGIVSSYTSQITPTEDGQVTISVDANRALDFPYLQGNIASEQKTTVYDGTRPTVFIDAPAQANAPFTATFTFSEDVSGFDESDITVVNGTADTVSGSGSSYTSQITPTEDGEVTIDVAAGKAQDAVGNTNTAADQAICDYGVTPFIQHILQLLLLKK